MNRRLVPCRSLEGPDRRCGGGFCVLPNDFSGCGIEQDDPIAADEDLLAIRGEGEPGRVQ